MTLRDAVRSASNTVSSVAREEASISSDPAEDRQRRAAAFARVIASEVGDTWMRRSRGLERDFARGDIYLKFEGDNPTGTQKDRIAFAHVLDAVQRGLQTIAYATCGNYGVAVALAAKLAGLRCEIFVPAGYHTKRLGEMEELGGRLHRPPGTYEDVVARSSEEARRRGWYDANPGKQNTALQLGAYAEIAHEIYRDLGSAPATVAVPVSNGTLLAGIHHGFEDLRKRGLITAVPRLVAASSTHKNPIVTSFLAGSPTCNDLLPEQIRETTINEPLINWHSFDGQEALDALYRSGGDARHVSDEKMRKMSAYLSSKEALQVLPASTAGLIALLELPGQPHEISVAVLTAKR
ncbi:pyridoxal-phosphate dependent enzyme [Lewinella sp. JB7]|uniref:pyridoxal-phosphate dependent enzyme n=1 Tax=Lewinella sp. JB7 TaxID=2962887 RepID=UPI0020C93ED6|nr:pyridoxal-phosphate dependent enzyme [Lewinella sp. JB7]MCP9235205.1 pyridoxal-phosphate dependent enzyme [Lewinella sp. JB7]